MHAALLALTLLTLGAAGIAWALKRAGLSPLLGYLILGIVAAPFQDALFENPKAARDLAEFGVILLMFFIGLEFHLGQLRSMLLLTIGSGTIQVALTALLAGATAWLCGASPPAAAVLGLMVAFSSTALVMKAFEDRRESDSHRARLSIAVLLMQDIAAILAVAVLPLALAMFASAPSSGAAPLSLFDGLKKIGVLFIVLPFLFVGTRYLLPKLFEKAALARAPDVFSLLSLGACFSVALAAEMAGASLALGAFLGGLVLSETPFASQIMADLSTVRNLALAFFFVSVGMLVDLAFVREHLGGLMLALAGLVILKSALTALALRCFKVDWRDGLSVGLCLAQIGEFSFVLGGASQNVLDRQSYQFVLALAVLSMLLTPFLVAFSGKLSGAIPVGTNNEPADKNVRSTPEQSAVANLRAIVVGYGPVGRTLTRILRDFGITPVIVDMNFETVKKLTQNGMIAVYGDAGRRDILLKAGVEESGYLLVTLPDLAARMPVVATARMLNPNIKILTRARYLGERAMLEDAGATSVSYEEAEVAVSLAKYLLREIGARETEIEREAQRIRSEISMRTGFTSMMPSPKRES